MSHTTIAAILAILGAVILSSIMFMDDRGRAATVYIAGYLGGALLWCALVAAII